MNKETKEFLNELNYLENKLIGKDKEIFQKAMFLFNECARILEEKVKIIDKVSWENTRLLELCMYALTRDTKIYNHELDKVHKAKFMNTIKNNLNDDTYTLRKKLIDIWEGK